VSNPTDKPSRTSTTYQWLSIAMRMLFNTCNNVVPVLWKHQCTDWNLAQRPLGMRWFSVCIATTWSSIFDRNVCDGVITRIHLTIKGELLDWRVDYTFLRDDGNTPDSREALTIEVMVGAKASIARFSILVGAGSNIHYLVLVFTKSSLIWCTDRHHREITECWEITECCLELWLTMRYWQIHPR